MYFFFFFPTGTDSRSDLPPVGTVLLLGVLGSLFSLRFFVPELYYELVSSSFRASSPTFSGAFLSLFLHSSWTHLLGNSLYLWIFGRQLEGRLGFAPFAAFFFGGGMVACWFQARLTPPDSWAWDVPLIGASGAVAALLGATLLRFHFQRVRVLYFLFALLGGITKGGVVHVNTVLACAFWFVFQVVHGLVAWGNGGGGVAYAAHAGGFVSGLALGVLFGLPWQARADIHRERGRQHFEKGNWFAAAGELTSHLALAPHDREARRMRARCLVLLGRVGEAARDYLTVFRELRRTRDPERIARTYQEMRMYGVGTNLTAPALLRLAFDLQKGGFPAGAAEAFEELVTRFPAGPQAELAMVRRAEILWSDLGRVEDALHCYERVVESYPRGEWGDFARGRLRSMKALTGARASATSTPSARARPAIRPWTSS